MARPRRGGRRPLRDRRARHLGLRRADAVAARDGRRLVNPARAALHDRSRRPMAACATGCRGAGRPSTTASCARGCGPSAATRFERRRSRAAPRARGGDVAVRTDPGVLRAPLVVDALGWRRVLASARSSRPSAAVARPRGPSACGGEGDALDVWVERSLVRRGYGWRVPAGAEARIGSAPTSPATTSRAHGRARRAPRSRARAFRATGSPTACARRSRTASSASATAPATAPAVGEGIRTAFYFGVACGPRAERVARRPPGPGRRPWRATPRSTTATPVPPRPRCSGSSRRCRPGRSPCSCARSRPSRSSTARSAGTSTRLTRPSPPSPDRDRAAPPRLPTRAQAGRGHGMEPHLRTLVIASSPDEGSRPDPSADPLRPQSRRAARGRCRRARRRAAPGRRPACPGTSSSAPADGRPGVPRRRRRRPPATARPRSSRSLRARACRDGLPADVLDRVPRRRARRGGRPAASAAPPSWPRCAAPRAPRRRPATCATTRWPRWTRRS